ncbi:MAG: allantoate amidohydrolase [Thermobacillus sp. ZCTH02-B1]|uniref:Zn-dependent hydrolase n=1 Tax=Thermobacillus sp. ZCTH02-B1 TaxID=1858795 RepID=UPI000B56712F|nr:Zn-dependent hydrolase [Thermobacillus sp. ZCTH02-B1]OUM96999.1 MAG: allantoate amidohydrolase [Thermobacillus sp. ZCTH02-B1]
MLKLDLEAEFAESVTGLLDELAMCGAERNGGVTRLLYTPSWLEAQRLLERRMTECGLTARYDCVGNLFGRLAGRGSESGVVLTGSHIDTVRSGGKYDGAYGIAASLTAVKFLHEKFGPPLRPIEVVSFCEEEGSRFPLAYWGSGNVSGTFSPELADGLVDAQGVTMREAMEAAGFGGTGPSGEPLSAKRTDLAAFVEVHIEQGMTLERFGERIGIVETIAGQRRYVVTVLGEANHAGTTPMALRRDAMAGAAEMIAFLERAAQKAGDPLVATVGSIECVPNVPNVIAGSAEFTLDIRHMSETLLTGFCDTVLGTFRTIAERRGLKIRVRSVLHTRPAPMDPVLTGRLERICSSRGIPYRRMMSGAGHDAQMFRSVCPTAMLFVPSRGGISHSPDEYTPPEDLALGTAVLAELLYELAYGEKCP